MSAESLFSFEFYVHNIEHINVPCIIPAVAFRLLDYPTVIVYSTQPDDINKLKEKLGGYSQNKEDLYEISKLQSRNNGFKVCRGKSCLLKQKFEQLYKLCNSVPLYITLIDVWADKPKLIGSSMIPLANLTQQIKKSFQQLGYNTPASGQLTGKYTICNLMGTSIGKIDLDVKLTCFGGSLLQHVHLNTKEETSQIDLLLDRKLLDEELSIRKINDKAISDKIDTVVIPASGVMHTADQHSAKMKILDGNINKAWQNKNTQCSISSKQKRSKKFQKTFQEKNLYLETVYDNIICPPPLCLNLAEPFTSVKSRSDKVSDQFVSLETDLRACESIYTDEEPDIEILQPKKENIHSYDIKKIKKQINKVRVDDKNSPLDTSINAHPINLDNVPLLCSLLKEITNLTNNLLLPKPSVEGKETKNVGTITKPQLKSIFKPPKASECSHVKSHKRTDQSMNIKAKLKKDVMKQTKKKTRKLVYGITRTQRLRYRITHQNEPLPNTSIELHQLESRIMNDVRKQEYLCNSTQDICTVLSPIANVAKSAEFIDNREESSKENEKVDMNLNGNTNEGEKRQQRITVTLPTSAGDTNNTDQDEPNDIDESSFVSAHALEKNAGFYSPKGLRSMSVSELGVFDDLSPWSSTKIPENYDDDSFHSDEDRSSITGTSSISLPTVSNKSNDNFRQKQFDGDRTSGRLTSQQSNTRNNISRLNSQKSIGGNSAISSSATKVTDSISQSRQRNSSAMSSLYTTRSNSQSDDTDSSLNNVSTRSNLKISDHVITAPMVSSHSPIKSKRTRRKQMFSDKILIQNSINTLSSPEKKS